MNAVRRVRTIILSPMLAGMAGIVGFALILEGMIELGLIPELIIPRPSDAVAIIPELHDEADLIGNFFVTLGMTAASTMISIVLGVPFGYLLYRSARLGKAYEGWLAATFSSPTIMLYPLFLVVFGRTHWTLILMAVTSGIIPIVLQTRQGLVGVSKTLINVGRSFHLTERQLFWKVMLPAAVPSIFNGIRLGVMYTLVVVVAIEYLIDFGGLGRIVSDMYLRFEIPKTYAGILCVIVVSVVFYSLFEKAEKWLRPA